MIYRFDSRKELGCYGDLLRKLKDLCGWDPFIRDNSSRQLSYGGDSSNAMICLYRDDLTLANVYLMYMAPNGYQKLLATHERVSRGAISPTHDPNNYNEL